MDDFEFPSLDDVREDRILAWGIIGAITGLMALAAVASWAINTFLGA